MFKRDIKSRPILAFGVLTIVFSVFSQNLEAHKINYISPLLKYFNQNSAMVPNVRNEFSIVSKTVADAIFNNISNISEFPLSLKNEEEDGDSSIKKASLDSQKELPKVLNIGGFVLKRIIYTKKGVWNSLGNQIEGVSGKGWLSFNCENVILSPTDLPEYIKIKKSYKVVAEVVRPLEEINIKDARLFNSEVNLGNLLELELFLKELTDQNILLEKLRMIKRFKSREEGKIFVSFSDVTIKLSERLFETGDIIHGRAVYSAKLRLPENAVLLINGFEIEIISLFLTQKRAIANLNIRLPYSLIPLDSCGPAVINLRNVVINSNCEFYTEKLDERLGSFWIGDTQIILEMDGYVIDFSSSQNYSGAIPDYPENWKGIYLDSGKTIPESSGKIISNRGFLKGPYYFKGAEINSSGFKGHLDLITPFSFFPLQPIGYELNFAEGQIQLNKSDIRGGFLRKCEITLPRKAVSKENFEQIIVEAPELIVQKDGDLFGRIFVNQPLFWGELINEGSELVAYSAYGNQLGFFFLSFRHRKPYFPLDDSEFSSSIFSPYDTQLELYGIQGVTLLNFTSLAIFTPDTPDEEKLIFQSTTLDKSWLNVSSRGVHAEFILSEASSSEVNLGPTHLSSYVGRVPFLTRIGDKKIYIKAEFVSSAVYETDCYGSIKLNEPSNTNIRFNEMQFTSTAHNAGGQVDLSNPIELDYWGVQLVQQEGFSSAGLISVKTGQIVLTAAGIYEPRHFAEPFNLSWGELLANGNLGRLFFDYNTVGQKFDGLFFSPTALRLSDHIPGRDGYLQAGGEVHFDFFGSNYFNIHDKKNSSQPDAPWDGRLIELGFDVGDGFFTSDTNIARNWSGTFGNLEFDISYDSADQDGFLGNGYVYLASILDGNMDASIVLSGERICISIHEANRHDFSLGPVLHFGSMNEIWGCCCIEEGQLKRIMLGAALEASGNANVLFRSAAHGEIEYLFTPSMSELTISGDMYVALLINGNLGVNGKASFLVDRERDFVEGEVEARFDASNLAGGLSAEGKLNWHSGPFEAEGYTSLQGMLAVNIFSTIGFGNRYEGGFYFGVNAPKEEAWVLGNEDWRFALNMKPLPNRLTGVYGYFEADKSLNLYVISGGIYLYMGLGGFVLNPEIITDATFIGVCVDNSTSSSLGLPYIIGHLSFNIWGEILGGLVSAQAFADFQASLPYPFHFQGTVGLTGCALWVACHTVHITVGVNSPQGFYLDY